MRLVELLEAFDSSVDLQWRPISSGGEIAGFIVNEVPYVLQLVPVEVPGLEGVKTVEVSFFHHSIDGDDAFKTTFKTAASESATTVYGVVLNGSVERLPSYEAAFFTANRPHALDDDQHLRKIDIYASLAKRAAKRLGWELYKSHNGLLVTSEYKGAAIGKLKHWQQEIREAVGLGPFPSPKRAS